MSELIDKDELLKKAVTIPGPSGKSVYSVVFTDDILNAKPIEPKKGHWIDGHCSECGCDVPAYIVDWKWQKDMDAKFCSNCGAKMEVEE